MSGLSWGLENDQDSSLLCKPPQASCFNLTSKGIYLGFKTAFKKRSRPNSCLTVLSSTDTSSRSSRITFSAFSLKANYGFPGRQLNKPEDSLLINITNKNKISPQICADNTAAGFSKRHASPGAEHTQYRLTA